MARNRNAYRRTNGHAVSYRGHVQVVHIQPRPARELLRRVLRVRPVSLAPAPRTRSPRRRSCAGASA